MTHSCPDCDQACNCCGDIEDHDTGDEFYIECDHCGERHADTDDGLWDDDDETETPPPQTQRVQSSMEGK